jgi:hypothetical protein
MADPDKPWRADDAKKMTFDEMAARAQYEWQRAEDAEAEVRALHARADAPPTVAEAMRCEEVMALVEAAQRLRDAYTSHKFNTMGDFYQPGEEPEVRAFDAALANLKGPTP